MSFLNPFLLWALPLAAVPIVIHLLNRRRYRTVRWAAMEFLLRAMKRNRKRLRMEQWIVLALRTLAVLLLVLLVSRPQVSGTILGGTTTHHVVVLDDSASMAHRAGIGTAFDAGKDAVAALAERLAEIRHGDVFTLALASNAARPALARAAVDHGLALRVRAEISPWTPGDGVLDPAAALLAATKLARDQPDAPQTAYHFVTDLRRRDWLGADGLANQALRGWLETLTPDTERFEVIAVGPSDSENLAVVDVRCDTRVCTLGVPLAFSIDIQNKGVAASGSVDLTVAIDEQSRVLHPVAPLEPGGRTTVVVRQTFHTAGPHGLTASLPADRFAVDDVRSLAFEVRSASKVILVDGDPGTSEEESETYFLNVALNPRGETATGIDVRIAGEHEFGALAPEELAEVDMIWMCNVSRPDDATLERLQRFLATGGGIVFWLGGQVDVERYNTALHDGGNGLLPVALTGVEGDLDAPEHVHIADPDHALFARNTEELAFLFARWVQVGRHFGLRPPPDRPTRILLRVEDSDGPPLMVASAPERGRGPVIVIGTTADTHWTNWPITPVFMVMCQELHATAARPQDFTRSNLLPHESYSVSLDTATHWPEVAARARDAEGDVRTFTAPTGDGGSVSVEVPFRELRGYGLFELSTKPRAGGSHVELVSRNANLAEGDLARLSAGGLRAALPAELSAHVRVTEGPGSADSDSALNGGSSLWRWLGLAMLVGMLVETVLAWRFGRR